MNRGNFCTNPSIVGKKKAIKSKLCKSSVYKIEYHKIPLIVYLAKVM